MLASGKRALLACVTGCTGHGRGDTGGVEGSPGSRTQLMPQPSGPSVEDALARGALVGCMHVPRGLDSHKRQSTGTAREQQPPPSTGSAAPGASSQRQQQTPLLQSTDESTEEKMERMRRERAYAVRASHKLADVLDNLVPKGAHLMMLRKWQERRAQAMSADSQAELATFLDWFCNQYLVTDEAWLECYDLWRRVVADYVVVVTTAAATDEQATGPATDVTFYKVGGRWLLPPCRSLVTLYYPPGTNFDLHSEYGKLPRPMGKCLNYEVGGELMMSMSRDFLGAVVPGAGFDYLPGVTFAFHNLDLALPAMKGEQCDGFTLRCGLSHSPLCTRYMGKHQVLGVGLCGDVLVHRSMGTSSNKALYPPNTAASEHCDGPGWHLVMAEAVGCIPEGVRAEQARRKAAERVVDAEDAFEREVAAMEAAVWDAVKGPLATSTPAAALMPAPASTALATSAPLATSADFDAIHPQLQSAAAMMALRRITLRLRLATQQAEEVGPSRWRDLPVQVAGPAAAGGQSNTASGGGSSNTAGGGSSGTAAGESGDTARHKPRPTPASIQIGSEAGGGSGWAVNYPGILQIDEGSVYMPEVMLLLGLDPNDADYAFPGLTPEGRSRGGEKAQESRRDDGILSSVIPSGWTQEQAAADRAGAYAAARVDNSRGGATTGPTKNRGVSSGLHDDGSNHGATKQKGRSKVELIVRLWSGTGQVRFGQYDTVEQMKEVAALVWAYAEDPQPTSALSSDFKAKVDVQRGLKAPGAGLLRK